MKKLTDFFVTLFTIYASIVFVSILLACYPIFFLIGYLHERIRNAIYFSLLRWMMDLFLVMTFIPLKITGKKYFKRKKNYIIIVNHRSFFDIVITTPFVPRYNKTIAKTSFMKVPIFNTYYKLGTVLVERENKESRKSSYDAMKRVLQRKISMCIFPEGTRNKTKEDFLPFKDGAFSLAMDSGFSIIPAVIVNSEKVMPWNKLFYFKPHQVGLHFLPEVKPQNFSSKDELKNYCFNVMKKEYLKRKFKNRDHA